MAVSAPDKNQGSTDCAIMPSWMEEHGVSWENMANMENMENMENITIWLKTLFYDSKHKHYIYDSKQSICDWNTLFVNQMTQNTLFYGISADGRKW